MNWPFRWPFGRKPGDEKKPPEDQGGTADSDPTAKRPDGMPRGRPFQPGQSGNPGGRPRGTSITATLRELIDEAGPDTVALPLLEKAQAGNIQAIKVVLDRTEGPVKELVEHSGKLIVEVVYADADGPDPAPPATPGSEADPGSDPPIQCAGDGPAVGQDDARD